MKKILTLLLLFHVLGAFVQKLEKNYDFADNYLCSLSKLKKNDKVGNVSKEGLAIIQLQYDDGLAFEDGYTAV